ncbi:MULTISPECIES: nucleotidyltransferase family protein [unclassified Hydrogenobaculum]|jgi:Predicted nucleotidyltransferases|uniref:nucleotidyltransferase family protein n=1 Tax=unclassified Hydrogenobaculum TaxID=2622382 RepID=UPI0001C506A4|nr:MULTISPECIES: nucleotidyltransferase family protein [unclassified Hydrogenobaculum]AEF18517.1 DNA polymerase beta domain protein region [Hydrogenobaculum sp. 3684]AEG45805.1 DNA polymerase beta domain protein region [Hydrogenobaculum sp. SHO]AGG14447.1 DNA polymerase beta domain protein region [Hydrogenobaculum sp. HO]AGH92751.1 putative nucleotidyltransferase [Hydrogenobaculum sp. SN]
MNRDIQAILQERKNYLVEKFGVIEIAIFGSYARGEQGKDSDVDLIVDFKEGWKTFDNYMNLKFYLEELFGKKVDLVIKSAINPRIKPFIIEEAIYV